MWMKCVAESHVVNKISKPHHWAENGGHYSWQINATAVSLEVSVHTMLHLYLTVRMDAVVTPYYRCLLQTVYYVYAILYFASIPSDTAIIFVVVVFLIVYENDLSLHHCYVPAAQICKLCCQNVEEQNYI